ncbi:hypothetical protein KKF60_02625 [Patescibacteria group bacterium]|nr:hypothetical protein [Patescibacteria group bacterium]MBU4458764.1 hypothetical protein [Patescibacteria group bacterium]MCG2696065.1 hypothetical protein [Candidatus Portnoybacteria bacterium]
MKEKINIPTPEQKEKIKKGFFESKGELWSNNEKDHHFNNDLTENRIEKVEREFIEWKKFASDATENSKENIAITENILIPIPEKSKNGETLKIPMEGMWLYSKSNYRESDNDPDKQEDSNDPEYDKEYIECDSKFPGENHIWYYYRVINATVFRAPDSDELLVSIFLKPQHDNGKHAPIELRQTINLKDLK